jgi:hypothetical protein
MVMSKFQCEYYINPQPEEGDSPCVGSLLAVNENYLAIGKVDRIIIYQRNPGQQWVRFRTVSLPIRPSIPDDRTTYKLALTGDTLVIVVMSRKIDPQEDEQQLYPFQPPELKGQPVYPGYHALGRIGYSGAVYRILINVDSPLERIDHVKYGELPGFDVAAHDNKIAFAVATYNDSGQYSGYTTLIADGIRHNFADSGAIALNSNLLVVGNNYNNQPSEISIFDLSTPKSPPQKISIPEPISKIALTEKFIAIAGIVGAEARTRDKGSSMSSPKTLLINISDFSITPLMGIGNISIYKNRLVRYYPTTRDHEVMGQIELFDISRYPPALISKSSANIVFGLFSTDLLITQQHIFDGGGICVSHYA